MRRSRKFYRGVANHVYQRTIDGVQLFYCIEDCLVFFTIFAVCAKSLGIQPLALCLMHNHFHCLAVAETRDQLSRFLDRFTSWFVREYNTFVGRTGKLFKKNFGSAPKWDEKKLRSAIIYIGNNPVEKHFCKTAVEYRWNFLAYRNNPSPFSEKLIKRNVSHDLYKSVKEVDTMVAINRPLKYARLIRMFSKLSVVEREQLIDYIITAYLPLDYKECESYFKSHESMLAAMNSTTGEDYDIKESRDSFSIRNFVEMMKYMERRMPRHEVRKVTAYPIDEKIRLGRELQRMTSASIQQICGFLHIKPAKHDPEG